MEILLTGCTQFLFVGIPLLGIALYQKSKKPLLAAVLLFVAYLTYFLFASGARISIWLGQIFVIIWGLSSSFLFFSFDEVGIKQVRSKIDYLFASGLGILFAFAYFFIEVNWFPTELPIKFNLERFVYEFTMPGISEELAFRGIFLAILNRYLDKPLGVILVSILFVVAHLVVFQQRLMLVGNLLYFFQLLILSFVYGYLREKSGSLWPSIICHNLANGLYYVIAWLYFIF